MGQDYRVMSVMVMVMMMMMMVAVVVVAAAAMHDSRDAKMAAADCAQLEHISLS